MPYVAAVFDCNEEPWRSLNYGQAQQAMCDWLTLHDVDYMLCHRVEVLADGDGQLVTYSFHPDILDPAFVDPAVPFPPGVDDFPRLPPVTHPLRQPIPRELTEALR